MEYCSKCDSFCDSQPTIISLNSNVATTFNVKSNNGKETLSCLYGTMKVRLLGVIKLAKQWYHKHIICLSYAYHKHTIC